MSTGKAQIIKHQGIVESVDGHQVCVRILQASACSACAAARLCRSSEAKEKVVTAYCAGSTVPVVGEQVTIEGKLSQGLWAIVWAYVLPLVLMIAVLMIVVSMTESEGLGALAAVCSLVPYYTGLYMMRDRFQKRLMFVVQ